MPGHAGDASAKLETLHRSRKEVVSQMSAHTWPASPSTQTVKKKYTCNEKKNVTSTNLLWLPNRYPLPSRFRAQPWFPDVLQSSTPYCKVLLCTIPYFKILVRTTKGNSVSQKTLKYYCVLHCTSPCYKVRQSTSPTEQTSFTLHWQERPKLLQCHHILYLPGKITLQLHQILRLPQKTGQKVDGTDNPVEPHPHSRKIALLASTWFQPVSQHLSPIASSWTLPRKTSRNHHLIYLQVTETHRKTPEDMRTSLKVLRLH